MDGTMTWLANMATFIKRGVLRRSSSLGNLKPLTLETWAPKNSNPRHFFKLCSHLVHHIKPSTQMTLSWAQILDQMVHFSTVV